MQKTFLWLFMVMGISLLLVACSGEQSKTHSTGQIIIAKPRATTERLYFSGVIQPIKVFNLISPYAANIASMDFTYGEKITAGDLLLTLDSTQLESDFRQGLTNYLKAANEFQQAKVAYRADLALAKYQIVDQETLNSDKSALDDNALALLNAKQKLQIVAKQLPGMANTQHLESLSLGDINAIQSILDKKYGVIELTAKNSGIILIPNQADANGKEIQVGEQVKQGQVLVKIGDIHGFLIHIKINEVDINLIKPGDPVTVSGDGFPGISLQGVISSVAAQAQSSQNGQGQVQFTADVEVKQIPPSAVKLIHIGMNAKVMLDIPQPAQIILPIAAVKQDQGRSYVMILKQGKAVKTWVTTGKTTLTDVAILSGVATGDQIVVAD